MGKPGISGKLLDESPDPAGPSQGGKPVSKGQGLCNKTQTSLLANLSPTSPQKRQTSEYLEPLLPGQPGPRDDVVGPWLLGVMMAPL